MSPRILVVDDDADILFALRHQLESAGYEVETAEGYAPAVEHLKLNDPPDLAILDLMMEEKDAGFRLSYDIKRMDAGIPVIMMSSVHSVTGIEFDASTNEEKSWIKADVFLEKPVRFEQLKGEIDRLLQRQPSH